ncbi:hypothetical protein DFR58_10153 [Anaerobacterium chartisolvens]|uniref:Uncharacterized protein n=1 Tax=Anaerobacterium chartisolvens TaxID=1297424 RepID=A0A369BHG8_9FIRM|nr:hypothetical protein [Anaerobacterium chartisolvens]RCX20851.1 hypothetical protein DFR58_10153 [Anaerobacterium chartisolvens]
MEIDFDIKTNAWPYPVNIYLHSQGEGHYLSVQDLNEEETSFLSVLVEGYIPPEESILDGAKRICKELKGELPNVILAKFCNQYGI